MAEQDPILPMQEQDPILRLTDVALVRGGRTLFAGLSLSLHAGEAALVTGPNGVGKSSLLRLCAGLLAPDAGRAAAGPRALLAEAAALDGEATLARALGFWARMDADRRDPDARVADALDALALAPLADVPVRLLSAGQRRRAALARVVAAQAALWLLDEPANGLDTASIARLEALLAAHRAGGGAAMVATHQPIALPGAVAVDLRDHPPFDRPGSASPVHPEHVEESSLSPGRRTVPRQAQHERERERSVDGAP